MSECMDGFSLLIFIYKKISLKKYLKSLNHILSRPLIWSVQGIHTFMVSTNVCQSVSVCVCVFFGFVLSVRVWALCWAFLIFLIILIFHTVNKLNEFSQCIAFFITSTRHCSYHGRDSGDHRHIPPSYFFSFTDKLFLFNGSWYLMYARAF